MTYKVTIYFRTAEAIIDKLTNHLASYFRDAQRWKRIEADSDAESDLDFGTTDTMIDDGPSDTELSSLADTAVQVLTALFCAYPECQTKEATKEFLGTAASADDPMILSKLRGWTADILKRLCDNGTSSIKFMAEAPDKLRMYIDPYTTTDFEDFPPDKGLRCHPWPIISNIVYNMKNPTLNSGNEMRDAPGTLDSNQAHHDATTDSLRDADKIMLFVDSSSRAASNESVEKMIHWAYRRRGSGNIWLVLTKCDVNVEKDDTIKFNTRERQLMHSIQTDLRKLGMELLSKRQELRSCLSGTLEERAELEDDVAHLKSVHTMAF